MIKIAYNIPVLAALLPIALFAQPPFPLATSLPTSFKRYSEFRQSDAATLADITHSFGIAMVTSGTSGATGEFRGPTGSVYRLQYDTQVVWGPFAGPVLAFTKQFPDLDSFNQEFPNGTITATQTLPLSPGTQTVRSSINSTFELGTPVRVTNFAALQAWDGGALTVN